MRNPKYLLAALAIGTLVFLPQPAAASPLASGLAAVDTTASDLASDLVEKVHKKRRGHHRKRYHRRRHHSNYYYPYSSYYYCDDYYGYDYGCGYPRRYRHPGFFIGSPHFIFGFGF
jgi:hypothetical protein